MFALLENPELQDETQFDIKEYLKSREDLLDTHAFDDRELGKLVEVMTIKFRGKGDNCCSICLETFVVS